MFKSIILPLLLTVVLLATSRALQAQSCDVMVRFKDGRELQGLLLQLSDKSLHIDPEGPVSLRVIEGGVIDTIQMGTGPALSFSVSSDSLPDGLDLTRCRRRATPRRAVRRAFSLSLSGGRVGTGSGEDYYEGFTSGSTLHAGMRYYFRSAPQARRVFLGLSYYRSKPKAEDALIPLGFDPNGNPINLAVGLAVHHYGLEFGITSAPQRNGSYLYGLLGLAALSNKASVHGLVGSEVVTTETATDTQAALRFTGGGVIGLTGRLGLEISGGIDFLYAGVGEDYLGRSVPQTNGLLPSLTIGLAVDL